jgi:hypothetical protein
MLLIPLRHNEKQRHYKHKLHRSVQNLVNNIFISLLHYRRDSMFSSRHLEKNIEAAYSYKTAVMIYQTTRPCAPEYSHLHSCCHKDLNTTSALSFPKGKLMFWEAKRMLGFTNWEEFTSAFISFWEYIFLFYFFYLFFRVSLPCLLL